METLRVGLIGAGFMAKAHSIAYATMPVHFWEPPAMPERATIAEVEEESAREAARRFSYADYTTDWKQLISDPEIDVVDIVTPNHLHPEMAIAAAEAGKHVFCEKPLAKNASEARPIAEAVQNAPGTHMVGFNYRFTPAVVQSKKFIEEGSLGEILQFRGTYSQSWSADPDAPMSWRFRKETAGSGAVGDIGAHLIDLARYLVGEFKNVCATAKTWVEERPVQQQRVDPMGKAHSGEETPREPVDVDDEFITLVEFENGAHGSLHATRNARGRHNFITFEIRGREGSLYFNYERSDELQVYFHSDPEDRRGFRTIYTGPAHPYGEMWPVPAVGLGYADTITIEMYEFFKAIRENRPASPSFEDGYRIALICDAILRSAERREWTPVDEEHLL